CRTSTSDSWSVPQAGEPGAEKTVAGLQVMIEKTQRPVGGQRRQPQGQPCQLDCHGVEIHAVQATFRDEPPDSTAFPRSNIAGMASAVSGERGFVSLAKVSASCD